MKLKPFLNYLFLSVVVLVASCAALNQALKDNELAAYIIIKNSVTQYIDKRDNQKARAGRFMKAATTAESFIAENPAATAGTVLDTAKLAVNYGGLSIADRLLIDDLLMIIKTALEKERTSEGQPISDDTIVSMVKIINAVKAGARPYL